jgi:hypothetical protein
MSAASAGSTLLTYADSSTGDGGHVIISDQNAAVAAISSSAGVSATGTRGVNCTISVTQSDASRVAGTFDCKHALAILNNASTSGTVDMRGTFEAAR